MSFYYKMMKYMTYLTYAKMIIDHKDLIMRVTALAYMGGNYIIGVGGNYIVEYANHCKCGVCEHRIQTGQEPIH
jgi:hypothetical protein